MPLFVITPFSEIGGWISSGCGCVSRNKQGGSRKNKTRGFGGVLLVHSSAYSSLPHPHFRLTKTKIAGCCTSNTNQWLKEVKAIRKNEIAFSLLCLCVWVHAAMLSFRVQRLQRETEKRKKIDPDLYLWHSHDDDSRTTRVEHVRMSGKGGMEARERGEVQAQKKNQGERRSGNNRRNRAPPFLDASGEHALLLQFYF